MAFGSRATYLVPGDTNGVLDVFVGDLGRDGPAGQPTLQGTPAHPDAAPDPFVLG